MTYGSCRRPFLAAGVLTVALSLLTGPSLWARVRAEEPQAETGFPRTRVSDRGLYAVTVRPETVPPPLGTLHRWDLMITDAAGAPADGLVITVSGGMPAHHHGLPTHPMMTAAPGGGQYRLDGLKFTMSGHWVVRLSLEGADGPDSVSIPFDL